MNTTFATTLLLAATSVQAVQFFNTKRGGANFMDQMFGSLWSEDDNGDFGFGSTSGLKFIDFNSSNGEEDHDDYSDDEELEDNLDLLSFVTDVKLDNIEYEDDLEVSSEEFELDDIENTNTVGDFAVGLALESFTEGLEVDGEYESDLNLDSVENEDMLNDFDGFLFVDDIENESEHGNYESGLSLDSVENENMLDDIETAEELDDVEIYADSHAVDTCAGDDCCVGDDCDLPKITQIDIPHAGDTLIMAVDKSKNVLNIVDLGSDVDAELVAEVVEEIGGTVY